MYIFSILAPALLFLAYKTVYTPAEQQKDSMRWFFWGILLCFPALLIIGLFKFLYPSFWGSVFLIYSFGMQFFIMPALLAVAGIYLVLRLRGKAFPELYQIESFLFGWSSLFLATHGVFYWGTNHWVYALAVPLLFLAMLGFMRDTVKEFFYDDFPGNLVQLLKLLGLGLAAGLIVSLVFFNLGILALALLAAALALFIWQWVGNHHILPS